MDSKLNSLFLDMANQFVGYLPRLFAGILLLAVGWLLAWLVRRMIVQLAIILKLEYFLIKFSWGKTFSKADVRQGLYNFLGNIAFIIVFLIFLDFTLLAWKLEFLSETLKEGILYFPRFASAMAIFGIGWLIALVAAKALQKVLQQENIPRASLITHFSRTMLVLLFSAMALAQLNVAREIVIIGFTTIFVTLGLIAVILTAVGGRELFKKMQDTPGEQD
jgi:Mechanosensitive ion channel, conserved TM helix